jgi:hypothetical protein
MTLFVVDVSRYQTDRAFPIDLAKAKAAGFRGVNIAVSGRAGGTLPTSTARQVADRARQLDLGISTYHFLTAVSSGRQQAQEAYAAIREIGGPDRMAHVVDCEADANETQWRDYVDTMRQNLGRHVAAYTGAWWWRPRSWSGAVRAPYLWATPSSGYLSSYPGDQASSWLVDYGGWTALAAMQYAVTPLPGTGPCSLSAIRDRKVWEVLTGARFMTDRLCVGGPWDGHYRDFGDKTKFCAVNRLAGQVTVYDVGLDGTWVAREPVPEEDARRFADALAGDHDTAFTAVP